jgi:hypothetical protein
MLNCEFATRMDRLTQAEIATAMERCPTPALEWGVRFEALSHQGQGCCVPPVVVLPLITRRWIAAFLEAAGVRAGCSTFIDDETITLGYGKLDEFGSWEFPL